MKEQHKTHKTIDADLVSEHVAKFHSGHWCYFVRYPISKQELTGKYLFYSPSFQELERIAIEEVENDGFFKAKIIDDEHKTGDEYVLCLYHVDDSRKHELANKYRNNPNIKYRYWKSDADTLKGKYSKEFLEKLNTKRAMEKR